MVQNASPAVKEPPAVASPKSRGRLVAHTVEVSLLHDEQRARAFDLFAAAYEGADRARFEADLDEKQLVIVLTDPDTCNLQGFSTVSIKDVATPGGPVVVVFSGDTVIARAYWGQKTLQREFSRLLIRIKLWRPARPLYWFLVSKGYKTYLLFAHNLSHAIPRCDSASDPDLQQLLDRVAADRFGDQYDPADGIVRYESAHEHVRDELARIDGAAARSPHVRFFLARNPGYSNGDELACLGEVRLVDPIRTIFRAALARVRLRLASK